jgi:two-component system LytT family response regulator
MATREMKILIVDDEELARKALRTELREFPGLEIAGECENGFEAVKMIMELKPDLVFLDIQMPRLDGFDVLELLGENAPGVIFVTAFDQYALKAFEAKAVDYLLKPVRADRLGQALERARMLFGKKEEEALKQELLREHQDKHIPLSRILIRTGTDIVVVPASKVSHIEAEDDYIRVHSVGKSWLKSERMNRIEELLDPRLFCRVHRSYIINIQFLKAIEPYSKESKVVKLTGGEVIPVSRDGYQKLKGLL